VRMPLVRSMSLQAMGRPASGPSASPFIRRASIASACWVAPSASSVTMALTPWISRS